MAYGYIVKLDKNVERRHARLNNRFGMAIAADLYTAKGLDVSEKHLALIVGAPCHGVKEQTGADFVRGLLLNYVSGFSKLRAEPSNLFWDILPLKRLAPDTGQK